MTGENDVPILRVELRPHAQAHLVGLPAKQLRVDRRHEGVHAIETFGSGAGRQPFEITVRPRDVTIRAGCDVDDDVSALRHETDLRWGKGKKESDRQTPNGRRVSGERQRVRCTRLLGRLPTVTSTRPYS